MSLRKRITETHEAERGAVGVLVAIILPALILFGSFVLDVGNAFVHHRHLQLQADAAALAGGQEFAAGTCTDANIVGRALQYSTVQQSQTNWSSKTVTSYSPSYNPQVGGTASSNMYESINSKTYLPAGNTAATDPTTFNGSPCTDSMLDVKATETNLPWYLQAGGLNYMNAHARVSWSAIGGGELPLAVDETSPLAAAAYFVNEATGTVLASAPLVNSHNTVGSGVYAGDDIWTSSASPTSLGITAKDIGVIIALSGDPSTTMCGQPLVTCFNQDPIGSGDGLVDIQGYSAGGTGSLTSPIAGPVTLSTPSTGSCSSAAAADAYYSVSTSTTGSCSIVVSASINLGSNPNPSGAIVRASVGGSQFPLTFNSTSGQWSGTVTVSNGSGANGIDLWVCNGTPCNQTKAKILSHVQATFAANDSPPTPSSTNSGTIDQVLISEQQSGGLLVPHSNSFPMCDQYTSSCTHQLVVTADIGGSIHDAASTSDPLFALNFGPNNTSSQTGTIVCPPGNNSGNILGTTMLTGCPGTYTINYSPTTNSFSDPLCNNTNPTPGPADCVQAKNGGANGVVGPNLYSRFVTPQLATPQASQRWYCANNWSSFDPTKPFDGLPPDDSRIVSLFITPYDSFTASGAQGRIVPILDAAYFYVMGWVVSGQNSDPCATDPPDPSPGSGNNHDRIWGHFIRYTNPYQPPSPVPCRNSALGACVIALTQ